VDIPDYHDRHDRSLLLHDERTYGFNDVPARVPAVKETVRVTLLALLQGLMQRTGIAAVAELNLL
jgi:hypothetical protein